MIMGNTEKDYNNYDTEDYQGCQGSCTEESIIHQRAPQEAWIFDFTEIFKRIFKSKPSVQVTFSYQYVYEQDRADVLIAMHTKLTKKLVVMGILPKKQLNIEEQYDSTAIEHAMQELANGRPKFYTKFSAAANPKWLDRQ
jgi:hypothetical protein